MFWTEDDRICGNCAHWQEKRGVPVPNPGRKFRRYVPELTAAPCALDGGEVELCDAPGRGRVLMTADGNCRNYGDCWSPSRKFLRELREAGLARLCRRGCRQRLWLPPR